MSSTEEGNPSYLHPPFSSPSSPSHPTKPHRLLLALVEAGKGGLRSFVHNFFLF